MYRKILTVGKMLLSLGFSISAINMAAQEIPTRYVTNANFEVDIQTTSEITGLWWNENESGWGVTLTQQYDIIFVTIFTYNADGTPVWYVASNCVVTGSSCSGELYEVTGGSPPTTIWDGSTLTVTDVGDVRFTFTDSDTATMDFTLNEVSGSKALTRQLFSTLSPEGTMNALWWNANESGWGVTVTQQTDIAFATIFTYDSGGMPTWYVASNCVVVGTSCSGALYEVSGGTEITQPWDGTNKVVLDVGTLSFDFVSNDAGSMDFEINTVSGNKSITRQIWATSPSTPPIASNVRDFKLPTPLFASDSAWNQTVTNAAPLPESEDVILTTYRVLRGDIEDQRPLAEITAFNWPFLILNYDDWTVPVFRGGGPSTNVLLCDYDGNLSWHSLKFADQGIEQIGGPVMIPGANDTVRPSDPTGLFSDGHLVLIDTDTSTSYEFWQATTQRDGECQSSGGGLEGTEIPEAGAIDFFDMAASGTNDTGTFSARASGASLLAGLFVPEDLESGEITHALALAILGPRNLSTDPSEIASTDAIYPAAVTETDFYSVNPSALVMGQRLRLKDVIVDDEGNEINEAALAPISRLFLKALREYGAYFIENAGGFLIYTEDTHTGFLDLSDADVNSLVGAEASSPIPSDKTKWQLVIEKLAEEIADIPIASGPWEDGQDLATATIDYANFELVENAEVPQP